MNELQMVGLLVAAVVTLGGFIGIIVKFTQPINDLRIVIQKLNDNIDSLKNDNTQQTKRIDKHGEQIDKLDNKVGTLDHRVGTLETKMDFYHHES